MTTKPIFATPTRRILVLLFWVLSVPGNVGANTARLGSDSSGSGAEFGYSTAMDGLRLAIGSPGEAAQSGAVYTYVCDAGRCLEPSRLVAGDVGSGDLFGNAVALSVDTLAIAAPGQQPGAVYVFTRSGSTWVQQARIIAPDGTLSAGFGRSLAVQGDRLLVGADNAIAGIGAAYVYNRSGASWAFQARLAANDGLAGDRFGSSVALSGDSVLIGAPFRPGVGAASHAQGAAYVFVHTLGNWSQQARLTAAAGANGDNFAAALALEGDRALIGAPLAGVGVGRAYVFERAGAAWTAQAQLSSNNSALGDRFGWSVALDGDDVVVGAPFALATCGASYRFRRNGAAWTTLGRSSVAVPLGGNLAGWSVAADGGRFLVGAPGFAGAAEHFGAGYWFDPIEQIFADGVDDNAGIECVLPAA